MGSRGLNHADDRIEPYCTVQFKFSKFKLKSAGSTESDLIFFVVYSDEALPGTRVLYSATVGWATLELL